MIIDYTPIANVNDKAVFDGRSFTMSFDVPSLTEGAHVLWARRHDDPRGYAHRDVPLALARPDLARGSARTIAETHSNVAATKRHAAVIFSSSPPAKGVYARVLPTRSAMGA